MLLLDALEESLAFFVLASTLLGLAVGSFLNVVVHRLPIMMERAWNRECRELLEENSSPLEEETFNLVAPRSRCPHCSHRITALENIPIISYLVLRGRCSGCGARISIRYPAIEATTGLLTGFIAFHFGFGLAAAGAMLLTWAFVAASAIDIDTQLLPDSITLPLLWLGLGFNLFAVYTSLPEAVIGAMAGYLSLWSVYHAFRLITGKEGMGYGDFKLLAVIGAWLGWQSIPLVVLLSSFVGAVIGIGLIVIQGRDRAQPLPFGPYLAIAGWIALIWGDAIVSGYLGLFSSAP